MVIKELKKKNYIRYLQILYHNEKSNDLLALIFLLENELTKIYMSSEDKFLREIKYQWLIEEFNKNSSYYSITNKLQEYKSSTKVEIEEYINAFKNIEINNQNFIEINAFKTINRCLNVLIKLSSTKIKLNSNLLFSYFYFLYNLKEKKLMNKEIFENYLSNYALNNIDKLEATFIRLFRKNYEFRINKLNFFLFLFINKLKNSLF